MPLNLFPTFGEAGFAETAGLTYQHKITEGAFTRYRVSSHLLKIEFSLGQQPIDVARADFMGDGLEDILLFTYMRTIGGTFGYGSLAILSRRTNDGSFELVGI